MRYEVDKLRVWNAVPELLSDIISICVGSGVSNPCY